MVIYAKDSWRNEPSREVATVLSILPLIAIKTLPLPIKNYE